MVWNIVASIGASLIGGALSRKTAKKERENHFVNLRESAIKGGFSPLSVLRATGGGGYGGYVAALSHSPWEGALAAGANAYGANYATRVQHKHELTLENMRQTHETKLAKAANAAMTAGLSRATDVAGNEMIGGTAIAGSKWKTNSGWSDAELIEQRYGDLASWFYGIGTAAADAYENKEAIGQKFSPLLTRAKPSNGGAQNAITVQPLRDFRTRFTDIVGRKPTPSEERTYNETGKISVGGHTFLK